MLKYLQSAFDKLSAIKSGITKNTAPWTSLAYDAAAVQANIDAIKNIHEELEALQDQVSQKKQACRKLAKAMNKEIGKLEKVAIGIHAANPEKLVEYNIMVPTARKQRPIPGKAVIKFITDDADGIGFKLKVQSLANVDYYEWERGSISSNDPTVTVLQTPYPFWRSNRKKQLVDNDIVPGIRYFYRVRGLNATGAGAWSEPVSRVQ